MGQPYAHAHRDAVAHADGYAHAHRDAVADADRYAHAHRDAVAHAGDAHGDAEVYA